MHVECLAHRMLEFAVCSVRPLYPWLVHSHMGRAIQFIESWCVEPSDEGPTDADG